MSTLVWKHFKNLCREVITLQTCSECLWFAPYCPYTASPPACWKFEDESEDNLWWIQRNSMSSCCFSAEYQTLQQRLLSLNITLDVGIAYKRQQCWFYIALLSFVIGVMCADRHPNQIGNVDKDMSSFFTNWHRLNVVSEFGWACKRELGWFYKMTSSDSFDRWWCDGIIPADDVIHKLHGVVQVSALADLTAGFQARTSTQGPA